MIVDIALLVDQDGRKVLRTFRGTWLVGFQPFADARQDYRVLGTSDGLSAVDWAVARGESGKFVVYKETFKGSATIQVFDSFEEMARAVPAKVETMVARACGLLPKEEYPIERLDV
jgi:hypothetical protein